MFLDNKMVRLQKNDVFDDIEIIFGELMNSIDGMDNIESKFNNSDLLENCSAIYIKTAIEALKRQSSLQLW